MDSATYLPSASLTSSWRCRCRWLQCAERRYGCDRCDCALQSFVLAHVSPFFSLRCIAISTLGFVNQLPRRFRRTKRELSSSQSEYLSQTLFPSTVIPNIPSRLNHDSCFCCMMCKRSGGGAASQAEVRQVRRRLGRYERSGWLSRPQTWTAPAARTGSRRTESSRRGARLRPLSTYQMAR